MSKKKARLVFSATDFFGNLVELPEDTWLNHILDPTDGHPQMSGYENLVHQVLRNPLEVRLSSHFDHGVIYVSEEGLGPSPEGIRVAVAFRDLLFEKGESSGVVTTAYPIDWIGYPAPRLGKQIYRKKKQAR